MYHVFIFTFGCLFSYQNEKTTKKKKGRNAVSDNPILIFKVKFPGDTPRLPYELSPATFATQPLRREYAPDPFPYEILARVCLPILAKKLTNKRHNIRRKK